MPEFCYEIYIYIVRRIIYIWTSLLVLWPLTLVIWHMALWVFSRLWIAWWTFVQWCRGFCLKSRDFTANKGCHLLCKPNVAFIESLQSCLPVPPETTCQRTTEWDGCFFLLLCFIENNARILNTKQEMHVRCSLNAVWYFSFQEGGWLCSNWNMQGKINNAHCFTHKWLHWVTL